jgi:hypothetical protein
MRLEMLGKNTSTVEVTHISTYGVWILSRDNEMFWLFPQLCGKCIIVISQ